MKAKARLLWLLFRSMILEEWRLQSAVFSGTRFGLFPIAIFIVSLFAGGTVAAVGIPLPQVLVGTVILALALGVQAGSIGFESADRIEALLGETTLLLYSSRTHPINPRSAVFVFIVKDILYYTALFLAPVTFGATVGVQATGAVIGLIETPISAAVVQLTLNVLLMQIAVFTLGTATALAASATIAQSLRRALLVALILGGVSAIRNDMGLFNNISIVPPFDIVSFVGVSALAAVLAGIGVLRFNVHRREETQQADQTFSWLYNAFNRSHRGALVAKHVTDLRRSAGGLWKIVFSAGLILTSTYVVFVALQRYLALRPSLPLLLAGFVSVTVIPTYIWLMQVDSVTDYQYHPIDPETLFRTKAAAFALVQTPIAGIYFAFALITAPSEFGRFLLGIGVLFGVSVYLFGITVLLTGYNPQTALFEGITFTLFTIAGMAVLFPVIVIGMFPFAIISPSLLLGIAAVGAILGVAAFVVGARRWAKKATASK